MAKVLVEVEVDADGAIQELKVLEGQLDKKMVSALKKAGREGNVVFTQLRKDQEQARQASQLLSQTLGVQVPRAIEKIILQSKLMRTALSSAFSTVAVAGFAIFAAQAIADLALKIIEWWHKVADERNRLAAEAAVNETQFIVGSLAKQARLRSEIAAMSADKEKAIMIATAAEIQAQREALRNRGIAIEGQLARQLAEEERLIWEKVFADVARAREQALGQLQERVNALGAQSPLAKLTLEYVQNFEALEKLAQQAGLTARAKELLGSAAEILTDKFNRESEALRTVTVELERMRPTLLRAGERPPFVPSENDIALLEQAREAVAQLQLAQLEGIPRILAERDRELAQIDELMEKHKEFAALVAELEKQKELVIMDSNRRIAEEQRRQVQELASQMEGFVGRLTDNFTSFKNFWKNLWGELKSFFIRTLFEMLARWILFGKQMQGAGAGAGAGGGIGAIIGGLLGLGGGGGIFGTGSSSFASSIVAGESLGVPTGTGGQPGGGGGASASNVSALEKILDRLGIKLHGGQFGPLLAGGGALALLAGLQSGGPVSGGLLGALGGAGLGFALGGPIGALIGALGGGAAGGIAGLFSRGKTRRRAAEAETAFFQQILGIKKEYDEFRLAFEAAIGSLDELWGEFQTVMPQKFGKYGRRAVRNVGPHVAEVRRMIEETERTRQARGALIGGLPIPEFAAGGFVDAAFRAITSGQGKMLAFLHRGEAVLNERAVRSLGPAFIERANTQSFQSGGFVGGRPAGGGDTFVVQNYITPGPGMDAEQLARMVERRTIRSLQRQLADRGNRL